MTSTVTTIKPTDTCIQCGKTQSSLNTGDVLKRCTKCRAALYCSRDCQIIHWPTHKKICELHNATAATASSSTASRIASLASTTSASSSATATATSGSGESSSSSSSSSSSDRLAAVLATIARLSTETHCHPDVRPETIDGHTFVYVGVMHKLGEEKFQCQLADWINREPSVVACLEGRYIGESFAKRMVQEKFYFIEDNDLSRLSNCTLFLINAYIFCKTRPDPLSGEYLAFFLRIESTLKAFLQDFTELGSAGMDILQRAREQVTHTHGGDQDAFQVVFSTIADLNSTVLDKTYRLISIIQENNKILALKFLESMITMIIREKIPLDATYKTLAIDAIKQPLNEEFTARFQKVVVDEARDRVHVNNIAIVAKKHPGKIIVILIGRYHIDKQLALLPAALRASSPPTIAALSPLPTTTTTTAPPTSSSSSSTATDTKAEAATAKPTSD